MTSGDASPASVSISRDLEMSQFWQNRQPKLHPAVPDDSTGEPGRKWFSGSFSIGSTHKPLERPYVASTVASPWRIRTKQNPRCPSWSRHPRGHTSHCTRPSPVRCQCLVATVERPALSAWPALALTARQTWLTWLPALPGPPCRPSARPAMQLSRQVDDRVWAGPDAGKRALPSWYSPARSAGRPGTLSWNSAERSGSVTGHSAIARQRAETGRLVGPCRTSPSR